MREAAGAWMHCSGLAATGAVARPGEAAGRAEAAKRQIAGKRRWLAATEGEKGNNVKATIKKMEQQT